eukprot:c5656_g1_i1.p1 GENE.c5656_g1_i1~~c5656_g1_i1.p1  ORF type:complete len:627 (+),score=110.56 c5656_g1_i1:143-2023(+)
MFTQPVFNNPSVFAAYAQNNSAMCGGQVQVSVSYGPMPVFPQHQQTPCLATKPLSHQPQKPISHQPSIAQAAPPSCQELPALRKIDLLLNQNCDLLCQVFDHQSLISKDENQALKRIIDQYLANFEPKTLSDRPLASQNFSTLIACAEKQPTEQAQFILKYLPPTSLSPSNQALHSLIAELIVFHEFLHSSPLVVPQHFWAVALVSCLLCSALIHDTTTTLPIILETTNPIRLGLITCSLKNLLAPDVRFHGSCQDLQFCSYKVLSLLLPEGMRVPNQVVGQVIRPSLSQFCSATNISLNFVSGLLNLTELLPSLFNNTFLVKVLSILKCTTQNDHPLSQHPDRFVMASTLIQCFTALCTTIDCSPHIEPLCEFAVGAGFQHIVVASLRSFLNMMPRQGAEVLARNANFRPLVEHVAALGAGCPFVEHYRALHSNIFISSNADLSNTSLVSFFMNPLLSDVTLIVDHTPIPAHKMVLVRCPYFATMFTSSMVEASLSEITLQGFELNPFLVALRHIYGASQCNLDSSATDLDALIKCMHTADFLQLGDLKSHCEVLVAKCLMTCDCNRLALRVNELQRMEQTASDFVLLALRDRLLKAIPFLQTVSASAFHCSILTRPSANSLPRQ